MFTEIAKIKVLRSCVGAREREKSQTRLNIFMFSVELRLVTCAAWLRWMLSEKSLKKYVMPYFF